MLATVSDTLGPPTPDTLTARWVAPEARMGISFETFEVDADGFASAVSRADAMVGASAVAGWREAGAEMWRAA